MALWGSSELITTTSTLPPGPTTEPPSIDIAETTITSHIPVDVVEEGEELV
jgi:hypothetical protein